MTDATIKRLALLALCLGAMASSPDCPTFHFIRYQFDLPRPLPEGFAIPDSVVSEGYLMRSVPAADSGACRWVRSYEIRDLEAARHQHNRADLLDLRIDSTRTRVSMVIEFSPDYGGEPDYWATLGARLAVAGTGDLPRVAPTRTDRIGGQKQLRAWCAAEAHR